MCIKFKSSGHSVRQVREEYFIASWQKPYLTKRNLMSSRPFSRDMDRAGAERFAEKWGCEIRMNPKIEAK